MGGTEALMDGGLALVASNVVSSPFRDLRAGTITLGVMVLALVVVRVGIDHFVGVIKGQRRAQRAAQRAAFRDRQRYGIFASYDRDKRAGRLPSQRR